MDDIDEQDLRRAELDFCLKNSLDFVDHQALDEAKAKQKRNKTVGDEATDEGVVNEESAESAEEEKPAEWVVDVRYATRLLRKANEMRVKKRLCDLTVGLGDGKLEAHRSLLAAGSPFFKHLTETTRASTLNFFHVPCCVADILFDFIYTGEIVQEKVDRLSRSEKRLLRDKADLFQIGDQLQWLWDQLGLPPRQAAAGGVAGTAAKSEAEPAAESLKDTSEIVKRKVLYMNERRKQGDFTDWKIRISAVDIPVSKVFLAASSTYFADFFARNPMDAKSETYTLTELNRRTFRKVLNFIYTGHLIAEERELGELKDLLFQASYLGIGDLSSRLVAEMEARLTDDSCFDMFSYANTVSCRQLVKTLSRYIGRLGASLASKPGFLGLAFADLKAALLNPELRFDNRQGTCLAWPGEFENFTLDLLVAWLRVDRVRRSSHVTDIYQLVDRLGKPPFTGRRVALHCRLPSELNHVMSVYYNKMLQEPPQTQNTEQKQAAEVKQALRVRHFLVPTRLLASREFPLARGDDSTALVPTRLEAEQPSATCCWQLSPIEWRLSSLRIWAADSAMSRPTGLEMRYERYQLFSLEETSAKEKQTTVCCGFRGVFQCCLELGNTERVVQVGIGQRTRGGSGGGGTFIAWLRTCTNRLLSASTSADAEEVQENEEEKEKQDQTDAKETTTMAVRSPTGSRGCLHGLALNVRLNDGGPVAGAFGGGTGGGGLTVVWAVESDVDGLAEAPWTSVVEAE